MESESLSAVFLINISIFFPWLLYLSLQYVPGMAAHGTNQTACVGCDKARKKDPGVLFSADLTVNI